MDALRAGLSQSDTVTDAPSIGAAVGRASVVNVTYLTAAGADTAARGTVNHPIFIGAGTELDASAVGRLVSFGRTLTTYTDGRWIEIRQPFYGGVFGGWSWILVAEIKNRRWSDSGFSMVTTVART